MTNPIETRYGGKQAPLIEVLGRFNVSVVEC